MLNSIKPDAQQGALANLNLLSSATTEKDSEADADPAGAIRVA